MEWDQDRKKHDRLHPPSHRYQKSGLYFIILTVMNVCEIIAFISGEVFSFHNDGILPVLFYQI
jgi:hypothetical protein